MTLEGKTKIHFIGIGGIGMSAIAEILLALGYEVSGSDVALSSRVQRLMTQGARIDIGQSADHIHKDMDLVVHSTAIRLDNPERRAAEALHIPVCHRSEVLGELMRRQKGICVAGSHGKTTTSSMVSLVLEKNNLDPTIVVGGVINEIGSNAKLGRGEYLAAEADESDGSFLNLHPWYTIVTNVEEDHLDHYKDIKAIQDIFRRFVQLTAVDGHVLLCADCPEALALKEVAPADVKTYGYSDQADYRICNHQQKGSLNEADIYQGSDYLGRLELIIPGRHNMQNALAATICAMDLGLSFEAIAATLRGFHGTKRRFQLVGDVADIQVVDDYAHHPTEISATIQAAKDCHTGRVVAVFQPHRYSRTQFLADKFAAALSAADDIFLLDVYPAGEDPIEGVSSQLILDCLPAGRTGTLCKEEAVAQELTGHLQPGDMVLVMGAGSIWQEAPNIVEALKEKYLS
ncbi:UDP-N-acetylmuramate--L-alanine ligase [Peptococcus simiae]|uniref:UDP-N-acetylmuramate--L-alanine ligase n=1 Tax=Peptococcus simiae TaxID=1643805 RepID=A0ABW9H2P3_9FIRM